MNLTGTPCGANCLQRASQAMDTAALAGMGIRDVRTVCVERRLKQLRRNNGERLADATKAKIRNLMSALFSHGSNRGATR
jgi:hypothetical protein